MGISKKALNVTKVSKKTEVLHTGLHSRVVGQDNAVEAVVRIYNVCVVGLNSPGRPLANLLFLGPTGSGKTHMVEALADVLFGTPQAMMKIDCAELQHSHDIAKLIGSPPLAISAIAKRPRCSLRKLLINTRQKIFA